MVLDKIKSTCQYVMKNSENVKINYEKLDEFTQTIDKRNFKNWLCNNPYELLELDIERIVNFLLVFESIDYSFWGEPKWTIRSEEGFKDGSDALLYRMSHYVKKEESTDFSMLSFEEFKKMLEGNVEISLLQERYRTIQEVSDIVKRKMNGSFYQRIKNVTTDTELLDIIIRNFPTFRDERIYKGKTIYFYKLAQLLTSDILHIREKVEKISVDYSNLIGCADYKIPQILRALGIVEYSQKLARMVDSKKELTHSSEYEVEIRASQLVVLEYIKSKLKDVNSIDINDFLFLAAKNTIQTLKPYHLCRNTNY